MNDSKMVAVAIFTLVGLVSCARKSGETSTVVFEVPPTVIEKTSFSLLSTLTDIDDHYVSDDWSVVAPSGFDMTTATPFNCYAVMVGGPELIFKQNFCGQKESDGRLKNAFAFGPWVGAIPATVSGGQLSLEVPSGSDRVFYLIGFHATDMAACRDLKSLPILQSQLSKPYIIGEAGKVQLQPGNTTTVSIEKVFDSHRWFDDCQFNDGSSNNAIPQPVRLSLDKLTQPRDIVPERSTPVCFPVRVGLLDPGFKVASALEDVDVRMGICDATTAGCLPTTAMNTFENPIDCEDNTHPETSFKIEKSSQYIIRWLRGPIGLSVSKWKLLVDDISGRLATAEKIFNVAYHDDSFPVFEGPMNVSPDQCLEYKVSIAKASGVVVPGATGNLIDLYLQKKETSGWIDIGRATTLFSNASCTTSLQTSPIAKFALTTGLFKFYIKTPVIASLGEFRLQVRRDLAGAPFSFLNLRVSQGTGVIRRLGVSGVPVVKKGTCHGPIRLDVLNESGAAFNTTLMARKIMMRSVDPANQSVSDIHVYGNKTCTGSEIQWSDPNAALHGIIIPQNNSSSPNLYFKIDNEVPRYRLLEFYDSALPAVRGRFDAYVYDVGV